LVAGASLDSEEANEDSCEHRPYRHDPLLACGLEFDYRTSDETAKDTGYRRNEVVVVEQGVWIRRLVWIFLVEVLSEEGLLILVMNPAGQDKFTLNKVYLSIN
jgi:hypothetical protein